MTLKCMHEDWVYVGSKQFCGDIVVVDLSALRQPNKGGVLVSWMSLRWFWESMIHLLPF